MIGSLLNLKRGHSFFAAEQLSETEQLINDHIVFEQVLVKAREKAEAALLCLNEKAC